MPPWVILGDALDLDASLGRHGDMEDRVSIVGRRLGATTYADEHSPCHWDIDLEDIEAADARYIRLMDGDSFMLFSERPIAELVAFAALINDAVLSVRHNSAPATRVPWGSPPRLARRPYTEIPEWASVHAHRAQFAVPLTKGGLVKREVTVDANELTLSKRMGPFTWAIRDIPVDRIRGVTASRGSLVFHLDDETITVRCRQPWRQVESLAMHLDRFLARPVPPDAEHPPEALKRMLRSHIDDR